MDKPMIKRGIVEHSLGLKSRFDKEVLMLEKTVSWSFYGGNLTLINSFDTKLQCFMNIMK